MFDNRLAIIYGCGVSLWGVIFMEFWKRRQCVLTTKWLCSERADNSEVVRPEYIKKVSLPKKITSQISTLVGENNLSIDQF